MLLNYKSCRESYGSPYQIEKAIREGRLFKMETGVYSDTGKESEIEVLQERYPAAIVSFESAYFYYDMTDYVPEKYALVTGNHSRLIQDDRIRQYYIPAEVLKVGMVVRNCNGERIRTYDLERLVIETARMKCSLPSDLYKEVISAFRKRTDEIIPAKIGEYLERFPKRDRIERIIDEEVF